MTAEADLNTPTTVRETALLLGVKEKTVRRWIAEGLLPADLVPGPGRGGLRYLVPWEALVEFSLAYQIDA